jgi:hypothetical protein
MLWRRPTNSSTSRGLRKASRALFSALRCSPAMAVSTALAVVASKAASAIGVAVRLDSAKAAAGSQPQGIVVDIGISRKCVWTTSGLRRPTLTQHRHQTRLQRYGSGHGCRFAFATKRPARA